MQYLLYEMIIGAIKRWVRSSTRDPTTKRHCIKFRGGIFHLLCSTFYWQAEQSYSGSRHRQINRPTFTVRFIRFLRIFMSIKQKVEFCLLSAYFSEASSWMFQRKRLFKNVLIPGSCHKRQKPQAPTPLAPIRNRQTRKVANAKGLNRNTNLT